MSSDYKTELTEEQNQILSGIPCVSQSAFAAMAMGQKQKQKQNETLGDENDLGYSLNMAHSHTSILHQEAEMWKQRAQYWQKQAREYGERFDPDKLPVLHGTTSLVRS